jgi:hypothetical protein
MTSIVSRHLKLNRNGAVIDVPVSISWPLLDQHTWTCGWIIDWPDRQRVNVGSGIDAIQALMHALQMVGSEIYSSDEHRSGQLVWTDGVRGYGFPVPNGIRDLLIGDDLKYL